MTDSPSFEKPGHSKSDRKFAARWEQIVQAAASLFAVKGFHRTTTKDIAEAAQVSEGTLYNYFNSKDDILFGILTQLVESQKMMVKPVGPVSMDAAQFFTAYLNQRKEHLDQNFVMMQALLSEILSDAELRQRYYEHLMEPSIKAMEGILRMRVALGQIRDTDAALVSRVMSSLLLGIFMLKAVGDPVVDSHWDQLAELTTSMIFYGLAPKE